MGCVLSIPVHENIDCILNHLENIKKYVPSCEAVVLHVSGDSPDDIYDYLLSQAATLFRGFLFINPNRFKSHKRGEAGNVTGLSTIWCDNFRFISSKVKFDHYAMVTSNELFVRRGLETHIANFKCQYAVCNPKWRSGRLTSLTNAGINNPWETALKKVVDYKAPEMGVCEGSFFPFEVFKTCSDIVLDRLPSMGPLEKGALIAHQEYVLPTIIFNSYPELYDSIIPETFVFGPKDYDPFSAAISANIVDKIRAGGYPHRLAAKRVPRTMESPIRKYINSIEVI